MLNAFRNYNRSNLLEVPKIKDLIYEIRGEQVMLDSDLALAYEVETRRINEAVARNKNKFPERFSWILTEDDLLNLRSQFATSSLKNNYGGRRYDIRVFTEQGVAMLATILKSKTAIEISIHIMDAFVTM
ncbi:MAG TPA: DNA-binding protein [Firmicutes bacterium]|nr:DNA-binding protein [Bacillota bacterium]